MNNKNNSKINIILIMLIVFAIGIPLFAQEPTVGVVYNDATKAQPGYTLFGPKDSKSAYLIDNNGLLINQWDTDYTPASTVYLQEDGNLLRSTKLVDPNGGNGGFQVIDWDGHVLWEYTYGSQHHDIEPMPNGNVLLLTNDEIDSTVAVAAGRDPSIFTGNVVSIKLLEIANNNGVGEVVWEWTAWDHIIQEFDQFKPNFGVVAEHPELIDLNYIPNPDQKWFHANAVAYNQDLDQVMVSIRSYNEFWVLDHSTTTEQATTHEDGDRGKGGDILYRWGNPASYGAGTDTDQMIFGQHDPHWIDSDLPGGGNIMVFNNGLNRGDGAYSTVDEITPPINNQGGYDLVVGAAYEPNVLTWQYKADNPTDFYSATTSGAQRMPNGNTLTCLGVQGVFTEVTNTGEIVWKYINPATKNGILLQGNIPPDKNHVSRCYRYAPDYPGLLGKDLTPGDPIELYTDTDGDGVTDGYDNCINTTNPDQTDTDGDGIGDLCDPTPLEVDDSNGIVGSFRLEQNHPNPFNPNTNIEFNLTERSKVTLTIYNLVGNKVRTLANGYQEAGLQSISWDALDDNGNPVSSGLYFYTIIAGQEKQTKKMMLLR